MDRPLSVWRGLASSSGPYHSETLLLVSSAISWLIDDLQTSMDVGYVMGCILPICFVSEQLGIIP